MDPDKGVRGYALLVNGGNYYVLSQECYILPSLFYYHTAEFRLAYYTAPEGDIELTDLAAVQVTRFVKDTNTGNILKIARKRPWAMLGDDGNWRTIDPITDLQLDLGLPDWDDIHKVYPPVQAAGADATASPAVAPKLRTITSANVDLGADWHGYPLQGLAKVNSWKSHASLVLAEPKVDEGERYILSNILVRYAGVKTGEGVSLAPFDAVIYKGTERIVIRYFFGNDPTPRTVTICKATCPEGP